jgi:arginase family enzyme
MTPRAVRDLADIVIAAPVRTPIGKFGGAFAEMWAPELGAAAAKAALDRGDCPGAVVVVVHDDTLAYRKAFGSRALKPEKAAMTPDAVFDRVGLLTLDAHHDLRPLEGGLTNGNPVRALLEDGLPGWNVVQVGINPMANSPTLAAAAEQARIEVITATEARERGTARVVADALERLARRVDAIYVDLDIDVLDRAFAPACPGARPGGLTPAEVQAAAELCGRHHKVRAIDVVEVDPERDVGGVTVLAAASFVLAFASGLAARSEG